MVNFLEIVLILIIVGMGFWVFKLYQDKKEGEREASLAEKEKEEYAELGKGLAEYKQKLEEKKELAKEKILKLLEAKERVTHQEAAKELNASKTSTIRYLDELEADGKIKQVGKTGRSVFYTKK
ncbi:MAG: winged helix-turn-helix domain-containing protein [bacterium]